MWPECCRITQADINECHSKPCQHGGVCVESSTLSSIALGQFECQCDPAWAGPTCVEPACTNDDDWKSDQGDTCSKYDKDYRGNLFSYCGKDQGTTRGAQRKLAKDACRRACEICGGTLVLVPVLVRSSPQHAAMTADCDLIVSSICAPQKPSKILCVMGVCVCVCVFVVCVPTRVVELECM